MPSSDFKLSSVEAINRRIFPQSCPSSLFIGEPQRDGLAEDSSDMFEGWGLVDIIEGENLKWFEMMHNNNNYNNNKWGTFRAIEKLQQYAVRKNTNELVKCLSTLAEEGDTSSQIELATIYQQLGIAQDYSMAAASSQIAAGAGDAAAQSNLGRMIAAGQGMPTNWLKDHGLLM